MHREQRPEIVHSPIKKLPNKTRGQETSESITHPLPQAFLSLPKVLLQATTSKSWGREVSVVYGFDRGCVCMCVTI